MTSLTVKNSNSYTLKIVKNIRKTSRNRTNGSRKQG